MTNATSAIEVTALPAFRDNYIWTLHDGRHAVVVDPGDAAPPLEFLARHRLRLAAVLATHHHADHVGGIGPLVAKHPAPVYGPAGEPIASLTHRVSGEDTVTVPELGLTLTVIDIPGHTRAHIAYYGAGRLFCGDTLFACGCGRLFEGTAAQMLQSLSRLAALPDDTLLYCGHEYTLANIAFARMVEPGNADLVARERRERAKREAGEPTLPASLGDEKRTNPFLRCTEPAVIAAAQRRTGFTDGDAVSVFAALREWKNAA